MLLDYKFSIIENNNVPTLYVNNKLLLMHLRFKNTPVSLSRFTIKIFFISQEFYPM
jgi:hypothetical protein